MHRTVPFVLLLFASITVPAESRVLHVPAEFPTLAAAINASAAGDTIALAAGKYEQAENLVIAKAVEIKGESAETTIIQTTLANVDLIKVEKVDGFRIEKLTLEYTGPVQPEGRSDFFSLLSVVGGRAEVEDCAFLNNSGVGLTFKQGANGAARHCRAGNNAALGIYVGEANTTAVVEFNNTAKNGFHGIMVHDRATATLQGNRCRENGYDGILIDGNAEPETLVRGNVCDKNGKNGIHAFANARVRLADNTCAANTETGIAVDSGSTAMVTGNICSDSLTGIVAQSCGTEVTAEKNDCSGCAEAGVGVYYGAKATVLHNACSGNKGAGIWVSNWESSAEVAGNSCNKNGNSGVLVSQGAQASVRGNECGGNGSYGVLVTDEESGADIGENTLKDNAKGESANEKGLSGGRQYQVRTHEIGTAFMRGRTDYLERTAARLRKYQSRYYDGGLQLNSFYDGLLRGNDRFNKDKRPDFRIALEKWASDYPESVTPRVALAFTHKQYAWDARGSGWASEVTPKGRQGFEEHLGIAEKWCVEAESKPDKDPYLYAIWIDIANGQCVPKARIRELVDRGMAVDPNFYTLYCSACRALWPRWGGSKAELIDLFNMVHERTREKAGEKTYAFVVDSQFLPGAVYGDLADWRLLKAGFDQILQEFPESRYYLNRYCLLACVFKDKEKARELFGRIGDRPEDNAWVNKKENFARAKLWATSDGPLPDFFRKDGQPPGNADEHLPGGVSTGLPAAILRLSRQQLATSFLKAGFSICAITVVVVLLIMRLSSKRR